jgi:putative DNA primase/helicase
MLETAINYKLPVFPVKGKIPAIKDWQKLACSDPQKLTELFKIPHTGIGLATGQISGITVIDIDVKNGVNGFVTLDRLGIVMPATVCVLTPSGGRQYYFKYNEHVRNKVSAISKDSGIDIRNDGGLVIMPPSVYPTGGIYEFQIEQGWGEIALSEFPLEIAGLLVDTAKKHFELPDKIYDGGRNDTLFKYASKLRASGLTKEEILPALYTVNKERCVPPYEIDKLEIIADSACTYAKGRKAIPKEDLIYSDVFNAQVFYEVYGDKIKWCKDYGGWFIFNGKSWVKDGNESIKKYAMKAAEEIDERMRVIGSGKAKGNLNRINSNQGLNALIECAKAFMGCSVEDFDYNKYLFNCVNGTYDLSNNIFLDFSSDNLITKQANVTYDIHATCPLWEKFLNEIFLEEEEVIKYMQRMAGYSLTASTKEQCMFILYGHGLNGKNVFVETIGNILGNYAINCPSSLFVLKQNPGIPNDVARLKGMRFASASETNQSVNLDEELIKQLTGNKIITARFLNKEYFDFEATFKIVLSTNHKPNIRGTDLGIWRRIHMVPFNFKVTPDKDDKDLHLKLSQESSGIFNWMIEGHNQWKKIGLNVPNQIKQATQIYREEEDDLGQFIKAECILNDKGFIASQEFRERFKFVMGYPKGTKALSEYMARHGFQGTGDNRIYVNGRQSRGYTGIRWATEIDRTESKGWQE